MGDNVRIPKRRRPVTYGKLSARGSTFAHRLKPDPDLDVFNMVDDSFSHYNVPNKKSKNLLHQESTGSKDQNMHPRQSPQSDTTDDRDPLSFDSSEDLWDPLAGEKYDQRPHSCFAGSMTAHQKPSKTMSHPKRARQLSITGLPRGVQDALHVRASEGSRESSSDPISSPGYVGSSLRTKSEHHTMKSMPRPKTPEHAAPVHSPTEATPSKFHLDQLVLSDARTSDPWGREKRSIESPNPGTRSRKKLKDRLTTSRSLSASSSRGLGRSHSTANTRKSNRPKSPRLKLSQRNYAIGVSLFDDAEPHFGALKDNADMKGHDAPRATYLGSRQRSHLAEMDLGVPSPVDVEPSNGSSRRRKVYGYKHNCEEPKSVPDTDVEEERQMPVIRNIHELRRAGGNARIFGKMEAALEDLEDDSASISSRRAAALELAKSVQDSMACRQALDTSLEERIFAIICQPADQLVRFLLMTTALCILPVSGLPTLQRGGRGSDIRACLVSSLQSNITMLGIARDRQSNTSKLFQLDILQLCQQLLESTTWKAGSQQPVTLSNVALLLLLALSKSDPGLADILLSQEVVDATLTRLSAVCSNKDGIEDSDIPLVRLLLEALELSTISVSSAKSDTRLAWTNTAVKELLRFIEVWHSFQVLGADAVWGQIVKISMNLTNNSPEICGCFIDRGITMNLIEDVINMFRSNSGWSQAGIDNLVLQLGLLINLAEGSSELAQNLLESQNGELGLLRGLVSAFTAQFEPAFDATSEETSMLNVPFGYLAIFLCCLCANDVVRRTIRSRLHGQTLKPLLVTVNEFLRYHAAVADQSASSKRSSASASSMIMRIRTVIEQVQSAEKASWVPDSNTKEIATEEKRG